MEYKDYYKTLEVPRSAGNEEIKKQYRILARKFHPDVNPGDKNAGVRFSEISEAYEVLSDGEKRAKYDQLVSDWEQHKNAGHDDSFDWSKYATADNQQPGKENSGWEDVFSGFSDPSEFFRNIFAQQSKHRAGTDLNAELYISLDDAFSGGAKTLQLGDRQIRLHLKPGIWDRQTIKIKGKGTPGSNGSRNGDLYLTFLLQPHPEYILEGADLFRDVPVSIYDALLGASLKVSTLSGTFQIKIPPETRNGTVLKLSAKGFPIYGSPGRQGDLYLKVVLQLPEKLTAREKALFGELAMLRKKPIVEAHA